MKCALEGCVKQARRRFCSNRHKDKLHNRLGSRHKFTNMYEEADAYYYDSTHPCDSEALGQD